jgi:hypothetical protein
MLNTIYLLDLDINYKLDYLRDFMRLYWVKCDFDVYNKEFSYYWNNGMTKKNDIDNEIIKYFEIWKNEYARVQE